MKHRFGIRVLAAYEETAFRELRPSDTFMKVHISKVFRLHPLPHGLQRQQVIQLLKEWKWQAKPLQPTRGSAEGGSWEVGADSAPPQNVLPAFNRDVLISLIKDKTEIATAPKVVGPSRAHKHLRSQAPAPASFSASSDPWQTPDQDPWGGWKGITTEAPSKRYDKLATQLKTDLQASLQQQWAEQMQDAPNSSGSQDGRIQQLESDMVELKAHHATFHSWFNETGNRLAKQDEQLAHLQASVHQNQQDLHAVRAEVHTSADSLHQAMQVSFGSMKGELANEISGAVSSQMDRIEAMLNKRHKSDS
eukprot:s239_g17.t1